MLKKELILVKITFDFKGSVFGQREKVVLSLKEKLSVMDALRELVSQEASLKPLLFKEDSLRNDILVFVDKTDIITMKLFDMFLKDGQQITILPLAHGG
jgi:molybdopterin converting factor small subunit